MRVQGIALVIAGALSLPLGCESPPEAFAPSRTIATSPPPLDAGPIPVQAQEDRLSRFLAIAAGTAPLPAVNSPDWRALREAAFVTLGSEVTSSTPVDIVAEVLARTRDTRGLEALRRWVTRSNIPPDERRAIVLSLLRVPGPALRSLPRSLLELGEASAHVGAPYPLGALNDAMGARGQTSLRALALALAHAIGDDQARSFLRNIAEDRTRSLPRPDVLAQIRCPEGWTLDRSEAEALASDRLIALSLIGDRSLFERAAHSPSEPLLVRTWSRAMLAPRDAKRAQARADAAADKSNRSSKQPWEYYRAGAPCR
jgi:hypothetical protein